jgi:hypothetical protein
MAKMFDKKKQIVSVCNNGLVNLGNTNDPGNSNAYPYTNKITKFILKKNPFFASNITKCMNVCNSEWLKKT